MRINGELRELTVSGIIRPEDVTANNRVNHTQIAEARISYAGRGRSALFSARTGASGSATRLRPGNHAARRLHCVSRYGRVS